MADEKITAEEQVRVLTEQVGKLEQKLADERGVHALLKSEHKMRLDQGEQLIAIHAELEQERAAREAAVRTAAAEVDRCNAAVRARNEMTAERDALKARVAELEQQLATIPTMNPQETDAAHPE